jgi:4-hydroxy-3-polyprenylbenzoate decarboxylase
MVTATEMGAVIAPPVPAFYTGPDSVDQMVTQSIARSLDLFGIDIPETQRWTET